MKKVEAIIRPEKLEDVVDGLSKAGFKSLTFYDVEGRGKQGGLVELFRGKAYKIEFIEKVKIEIAVSDSDVEKVIQVITDKAFTGNIGDGKIFVSDIVEVVRIRTKERGEKAL